MTERENILRAIRFECPDHIPMVFAINAACWHTYPQDALFDLMAAHKRLFPDFERPTLPYAPDYARVARKDQPYTDDFGCVWQTTMDGITGTVTHHPLSDWDAFDDYILPDPAVCSGIGPMDWDATARRIADDKARGRFTVGGLRHGHTFLQLCDIVGYEHLLLSMADDEPRLRRLIDGLEQFNMAHMQRYLACGVDMMMYPEDLGMQNGPMLSPQQFRTYIKPSYQRLMKPARDSGVIVHMHSDGHLHALIDDVIDGGVDVINLQDLVNGVDWIANKFRGRVCVDLDIDRQLITAQGTPAQIDALIHECVQKLSTPEGGLMMIFGLYPGTPLENVAALMDAMERYM